MLGAITRIWQLRKTHPLGWWAVAGAAVLSALTAVIEILAGNAVSDFFNNQLINWFGPIWPSVWHVMATHFLSFVAAVGLLWIAISAGYWFGVRDPIAVSNGAQQNSPPAANEDEKQRRIALDAVREILEMLTKVERIVERSYGDKEKTRKEWLAKYRPEIQANVHVLATVAFVTPPADELDAWEAGGLLKYAQEIEPFLAKGLFQKAKILAAETSLFVEKVMAENRPKT